MTFVLRGQAPASTLHQAPGGRSRVLPWLQLSHTCVSREINIIREFAYPSWARGFPNVGPAQIALNQDGAPP
jgi:hypothetical protein